MGASTGISWADKTFSPWYGCTKVSDGCKSCYAEAWAKRSNMVDWGKDAPRRRASDAQWRALRKWNAEAGMIDGARYRVFPSLCDPFDEEVSTEWKLEFFQTIRECPNLDFLLLTKRPAAALDLLNLIYHPELHDHHWDNVWLIASVENQSTADERIPLLLKCKSHVALVGLSCEPLLGPIDLTRPLYPDDAHRRGSLIGGAPQEGMAWSKIDWLIVGGESGPNFRPMQTAWAQALADQCEAAGVPFWCKQAASRFPGSQKDLPDKLWNTKQLPGQAAARIAEPSLFEGNPR